MYVLLSKSKKKDQIIRKARFAIAHDPVRVNDTSGVYVSSTYMGLLCNDLCDPMLHFEYTFWVIGVAYRPGKFDVLGRVSDTDEPYGETGYLTETLLWDPFILWKWILSFCHIHRSVGSSSWQYAPSPISVALKWECSGLWLSPSGISKYCYTSMIPFWYPSVVQLDILTLGYTQ